MTSPWKKTLVPVPPSWACPKCGEDLDESFDTSLRGQNPQPEDVSICLHCGGVAIFTPKMKLKPITGDELILAMAADSELARAIKAAWKFIEDKK